MKPASSDSGHHFFPIAAGTAALGCALAIATSIVSVARHPDLVAYGMNAPAAASYYLIAGLVIVSASFLAIGTRLLKADGARRSLSSLVLLISVLITPVFVFGVYALEVKYQEGQPDLRVLEKLSRDLPQWQARAATIRNGMLRAAKLDPLPVRTPLNACIHSRREMRGYAVENVFFESIPGFYVLGNLYTPASPADGARRPAVLIAQGHFPHGRFNEDAQQLAATFARMGAVAFTYDMVGRGESAQVNHDNPNALPLQIWNSMRVLDFLLARADIDPSRIGMTGASGGGTQTFLCTALDNRIAASAPVVMVSSWVYGGCACEIGFPIRRGPDYETNNAEIAALAAPRPQLLVSVGHDWTRTTPTKEFPFIRRIYGLFGAADKLENVHLRDEQHDFGPSKRQAVYRFFAKHLGLSSDSATSSGGLIDESPNTVESEEAMCALNAAHPMPANALRDWRLIDAALHVRP